MGKRLPVDPPRQPLTLRTEANVKGKARKQGKQIQARMQTNKQNDPVPLPAPVRLLDRFDLAFTGCPFPSGLSVSVFIRKDEGECMEVGMFAEELFTENEEYGLVKPPVE